MMNPHTGLRLAFALASFSLTLGSFAQRELSLVKAQTLGVENAYAMQRARIDVQVAQRDVKEILATGLPQVNASFDFNHFLDIPTQVVPASSFDPTAPDAAPALEGDAAAMEAMVSPGCPAGGQA